MMGLLKSIKELWAAAGESHDSVTSSKKKPAITFKIEMSGRLSDAEYEKKLQLHDKRVAAITADGLVSGESDMKLLPVEIVFLWYINGRPAKNPDIALYWDDEYGVTDFQKVLIKLCGSGLLQPSEDFASNASAHTLAELKEVAKRFDIKVSGKKDHLVSRMLQEMPQNDVSALFGGIRFHVTEKGQLLLDQSRHLILAHKHLGKLDDGGGLTLNKVAELRRRNPDVDEYQLLIDYHKEAAVRAAKEEKCPPRNFVYSISTLFAMKGDIASALDCLLIVCYWDMSGAMDLPYAFDGRGLFDDENSPTKAADKVRSRVQFFPALMSEAFKYKSMLNLDDAALRSKYDLALREIETANAVYSKDEIFNMLIAAMSTV